MMKMRQRYVENGTLTQVGTISNPDPFFFLVFCLWACACASTDDNIVSKMKANYDLSCENFLYDVVDF